MTLAGTARHRASIGRASGDDLDPLRALCSAAWTAAGDADGAEWQVHAESDAAQKRLAELGLG